MRKQEEPSGTQPPDEDPVEVPVDSEPDDKDPGGNEGSSETVEETEPADTVPEDDEEAAIPGGSVTSDEETGQETDRPEKEFPEAVEYDYDGNDTPISYAKLKTLMNIRCGNSLDAGEPYDLPERHCGRGPSGMRGWLASDPLPGK